MRRVEIKEFRLRNFDREPIYSDPSTKSLRECMKEFRETGKHPQHTAIVSSDNGPPVISWETDYYDIEKDKRVFLVYTIDKVKVIQRAYGKDPILPKTAEERRIISAIKSQKDIILCFERSQVSNGCFGNYEESITPGTPKWFLAPPDVMASLHAGLIENCKVRPQMKNVPDCSEAILDKKEVVEATKSSICMKSESVSMAESNTPAYLDEMKNAKVWEKDQIPDEDEWYLIRASGNQKKIWTENMATEAAFMEFCQIGTTIDVPNRKIIGDSPLCQLLHETCKHIRDHFFNLSKSRKKAAASTTESSLPRTTKGAAKNAALAKTVEEPAGSKRGTGPSYCQNTPGYWHPVEEATISIEDTIASLDRDVTKTVKDVKDLQEVVTKAQLGKLPSTMPTLANNMKRLLNRVTNPSFESNAIHGRVIKSGTIEPRHVQTTIDDQMIVACSNRLKKDPELVKSIERAQLTCFSALSPPSELISVKSGVEVKTRSRIHSFLDQNRTPQALLNPANGLTIVCSTYLTLSKRWMTKDRDFFAYKIGPDDKKKKKAPGPGKRLGKINSLNVDPEDINILRKGDRSKEDGILVTYKPSNKKVTSHHFDML
ncbi:hypothetical protein FGRMN_11055 [Fusarium graminum]|nr:hypothetical protein FGRMN_11055 [Fusarium graminum]